MNEYAVLVKYKTIEAAIPKINPPNMLARVPNFEIAPLVPVGHSSKVVIRTGNSLLKTPNSDANVSFDYEKNKR